MVYPLTLLMPLNKKIWSISFVFLSTAVTGLSLVFISYFVDVLGLKLPRYGRIINLITYPFVWLGRNPLAIFILMEFFNILIEEYIKIDGKSLSRQFYDHVFESWITNP
jgi:predicted acyltransferase